MHWMVRLLAALALALVPLGTTRADESSKPEALHAKAVTAHAERLEELAAWCHKRGLYGTRDEIFEVLLRYDPEHAKARKWLKYKRVDGAWVQHGRYKRPRNFKPQNLPAFAERRADVDAAFAAALDAVFAMCRTPAELAWATNVATGWSGARPEDPAPHAALRTLSVRRYQVLWGAGRAEEMETVAEALRGAYPLDPQIRALLGEAAEDDIWLLQETVRARVRRAALEVVAKQVGDSDVRTSELGKEDYMLGLTGLEGFESEHIRAVGTIGAKQLKTYVAAMQGAGRFFAEVFGAPPTRRKTTTAYLLTTQDELDALLDRFPGMDPALADQQKKHGLHVFWANGRTLCAGPIPPEAQRELCLGVLFMVFMADTWFSVDTPLPGWLDEGIARHLAFLMTGTRFGIAVGGRYGSKDPTVARNVPDAHGNWLKAAHARLAKLERWDLRLLLGKGIDAYTAQDSMIAYVLSVYLLEGQSEKAAGFLKRLGSGEDPGLASKRALEMPLPILEHRLRRFLGELAK